MEKYLIRDWRLNGNAVIVELSNEEVSVLSHFINWAELTGAFSINSMRDISHVNWHDEYSIVDEG